MFSNRAIQLVAEAKLEAAIEAGEFKDLAGFGKPFEFDATTNDTNWWIRNKIKREEIHEYVKSNRTKDD